MGKDRKQNKGDQEGKNGSEVTCHLKMKVDVGLKERNVSK